MEGLWRTRYGQKRSLSACARRSYCYFELSWHMSWWTLPHGVVYMCLLHFLTSYSFQPTPIWFLPCHFTSDLKMLLNLMDDFQFLPCLVLPLGLQCLPFLSRLLSLCNPLPIQRSFLAPFDFLFFQCPLNDNLSLIYLSLSFSHSACALSYDICISKALITIFIQWIHEYSTRLSFELQTPILPHVLLATLNMP